MPLDPLDEVTPKDLGAVLDHTLDRMARRARGEERPVPLPWANVAKALGGGFWGGTSVGLLGDSGSGKTQFALQAALYAAESGVPICYVALQSPEDQVAARLLALRSGRNWSALYTGRDGDADIEDLRRTHARRCARCPSTSWPAARAAGATTTCARSRPGCARVSRRDPRRPALHGPRGHRAARERARARHGPARGDRADRPRGQRSSRASWAASSC